MIKIQSRTIEFAQDLLVKGMEIISIIVNKKK